MTAILDLPQIPAQAFVIARNCDFTDGFVFEHEDGTTIDITGIDFFAVAGTPSVANPAVLDILLSASTQNGLLVNGGTNGELRFTVLAARTLVLSDGVGIPMDMIAVGNDAAGQRRVVGLMKDAPSAVTIVDGLAQVPPA